MRSRIVAAFAVLAAAAVAMSPLASAREAMSPAALATLSGVDKALDDVATSMADQGGDIAKEGEAIGEPGAFAAAWRKAALATFAPDKLKTSLAKRLTGKLSPQEAFAVEDFYKSPLGQRIVAAEVAAGGKAGQEQMMAEAAKLMEGLLADQKRKAAIDAVGKAIQIENISTSIALNVSRAVMIGLASVETGAGRMTIEDIEQAIEQQKGEVATQMGAFATLSMAFAYRSLPMDDLKAYEVFLRSGPGAKYTDLVLKGLDAVLSEGGLAFGRALALELGRDPI